MAETVVKSVEIRESGAQRVYDRLDQLAQVAQKTVGAFNEVGQASEQTGRRVSGAAREYDRYAERMQGAQRAMRDYARDLRAIGAGLNIGAFGQGAQAVANYNAELRKIQQTLQEVGRPTGPNSGLQNLIGELRGIDAAAKSAQDSAEAMKAALGAIDRGRSPLQSTINEIHGIGQGLLSARDSMEAFGALFDREAAEAARATEKLAAEVEQLRLAYDPAYAAAQRMAQEIENLSRLEREGIAILGGYDAALDRIILKYDEAAQAARRAADAQRAMIESARAEQNAATSQIGYNDLLGVRAGPRNSARESGLVFKEQIDAAEALEKRLAQVRAEIDPVVAAQARYNAEIAEYIALNKQGLLSDNELSQGLSVAATRLQQAERSLAGFNDNTRLGTLELTNLQYQLNDIAVSLASGQSPFTVMLQQGAQIGQLFGPGATVQDALKSVGAGIVSFVTSPLNLAILGIAALAGSFALIYSAFKSDVKPIGDALNKQRNSVDALAQRYDHMAEAIERAGRASVGLQTFQARSSTEALGRSAQQSLKDAFAPGLFDAIRGRQIFGGRIGGEGRAAVQIAEEFKAFEGPLNEFLDGLARGEADAVKFQDAIAEIADNAPLDKALQKNALRLLEMSDAGAEAQRQIQALKKSLDEMKAIELEETFASAFESLRGMIQSTETAEEQIRRYAGAARDATRSQGDKLKIDILEREALDQLREAEGRRVEQHQLSVRAIHAQTVEERALITERQTYLDLMTETISEEERLRRAREAGDLIREQGRADEAAKLRQYTDAVSSQAESIREQVEALRRQADMFGQSEGAIAAAEFRTRALADAYRLARENNQIVTPQQIADIEAAAAEIGVLTDHVRSLREEQERQKRVADTIRNLQFEGSLIGMNDVDRDIATTLNDLQVSYDSLDGQRIAGQIRYNETLRQGHDHMREFGDTAREVFFDLIDAIGSGENALDAIANAFAGLGRQLASAGFEKLFGSLFGTGQQSSGAGILGALASGRNPVTAGGSTAAASAPAYSAATVDRTFAAPVAAVERRVLPALTDFSKELGAAAKAIRTIESGSAAGNYSALGPITRSGDRAYGAYQVMGNNIADWSRSAIGREVGKIEFLRSVELQDKIFEHRFGGYMKKYGPEGASRAWFAGEGGMRNYKAQDVVGTSVSGYGSRFGSLYSQHLGTTEQQTQRTIAKGTATGVKEAVRATAYDRGGYDASGPSTGGQAGGIFGPRAQAGFSVIGAGLGAFGAGYQSGSPLSGGLSGALGGYQAGGAISSALNIGPMAGSVLGVVGGAALGILGGILGARQQRKAAHKQAAEQWEQIRPQYEAFDKSLSPDGTGQIREWLTSTWSQLSSFMAVGGKAWKNGTGNSTAQFQSTGTKMFDRFEEMLVEFRDGFDAMIEDLSSGEGLAGAFAKGRAATKDLQKQIDGMLDDVSIAFGSDDIGIPVAGFYTEASKQWEEARNKAIEQAKKAAGEYSLSLLYTDKVNSDVEKALDGFRGTAAGLQKVLEKLGWTAEDAAADINERLTQAIAKMAETFTDGFQRQINDLSGVGYFNDVTDLLKARDTALSDAALLGVDPSLVTDWFKLAAQDIVNSSELTGSAFDALIAKFPELAGVVKSFSEAVTVTTEQVEANYRSFLEGRLSELTSARADAESKLLSAYQRTVDWVKSLRDFVADMNLSDTSPLSGREKADQARQTFLDLSAKAAAGDVEAQEKLLGSSQDLLDASRDYYVSSEAYFADFKLVQETLKATDAKTTSQLDQLRSQASFLSAINDNTKSLTTLMSEWIEADKAEKALQKQLDGNRTFGANPERNRLIDAGIRQLGLNYTGNYGFQADGSDPFRAWRESLPAAQLAAVVGVIQQYIGINRQMGGLIPGYAAGGIVGNGIWNKDSVLARYAGGGTIGLAGGEMVISAPKVTPQTYPVLDAINRTGRVPANDTMRLDRVESLLRTLIATTGAGLDRNVQATERGNRSAEDGALTRKRQAVLERAA